MTTTRAIAPACASACLAAAQHNRCAALWTNDDRLAQAAHLDVNMLGHA